MFTRSPAVTHFGLTLHQTFSKMPTDLSIETLLKEGNSFNHVKSIDFTSGTKDVVASSVGWELDGIPFVIRDVSLDLGPEKPFNNDSVEWVERLAGVTGMFSLQSLGAGLSPFQGRVPRSLITGSTVITSPLEVTASLRSSLR